MAVTDYVLSWLPITALLISLLLAIVRSSRVWVGLALVLCLLIILLRELSVAPLARAIIHQKQSQGGWVRAYTEGVWAMRDAILGSAKNTIASAVALVILVAGRRRR